MDITSGQPGNKCEICGKDNETRLGACWNCAEAESIISDGTDMYEKGTAKTAMDKLRMLIKYGWENNTKD